MQILAVIQKHGFTLEQVSKELGITKGSLSATISAYPNVKKLIDIAKIVGCHPAEFFDDWYETDGAGQSQPAPSQSDELPFSPDKGTNEQPPLQPVAAFLCPHCCKPITIGLMK